MFKDEVIYLNAAMKGKVILLLSLSLTVILGPIHFPQISNS